MMGIGFPELMIILVIIMIIFGAGKLPEIGSAFGRSIKNFKSSMKEAQEQDESDQVEEGQQASIEEEKDAAAEENLTDEEKEALARKKPVIISLEGNCAFCIFTLALVRVCNPWCLKSINPKRAVKIIRNKVFIDPIRLPTSIKTKISRIGITKRLGKIYFIFFSFLSIV